MQRPIAHALSCLWLLGALSCSASSSSGAGANGGQGGQGASGGQGGAGAEGGMLLGGFGGSGTGGALGGFGGSSGGAGGIEECFGVSSQAEAQLQPADIILAVDTSGSMNEEIDQVQQHLNDFSSLILASGIDVRVVLIADASICIPPPLGSGQCGGQDSLLPVFQHVVQTVASTDALELLLSTYPQWKDTLRPNATKTFLVVSDDNSDLGASSFTSQLLALDPPTFQGFQFDAIVANQDPLQCFGFSCPANNACCYSPGGFGCDSYAAAKGTVYAELVAQTGGVQGDLCAQEFGPIFQDMATGVVVSSKVACEYTIPEPPPGAMFDPTLVNVEYVPSDGSPPVNIYNVPGGAAACAAQGGWYYDDASNPTKIFICPLTCAAVQSDEGAGINVVFGCETVVVPN